jgi:hypothetical protein
MAENKELDYQQLIVERSPKGIAKPEEYSAPEEKKCNCGPESACRKSGKCECGLVKRLELL